MNVSPLIERWRAEAATFEARGLDREAHMARSYAEDLEAFEREWRFEELTLQEAAEETGLHYNTISRKVLRGEIPNAGEKHRPAVRRGDIVRGIEQRGPRPMTENGEPDLAAEVLRGRS